MYDDTRRLRRMLHPVERLNPHTGEALVAPRGRVLSATVTQQVDRWYVCVTVEAADYHPWRRHQHRSQDENRRFVGMDRGLAAFAVVAHSDGVEIYRVSAPRRWLDGLAGYGSVPACSHAPSGVPETGVEPLGHWPESTITLPTSVGTFSTRSRASLPRPTARWLSKTFLCLT